MKKFKKLIVTLLVVLQAFIFCAASFADTGVVYKQGYGSSLGFGLAMFVAVLVAISMFLHRKIDD
ncbi:MAG: hypothetical protein IJP37_03760 [Clostridia bacterium]|nr:hypothetical protein [Clostridia bacterium]MBR0026256.1 hypothetical protein [Clostridia bacterium]